MFVMFVIGAVLQIFFRAPVESDLFQGIIYTAGVLVVVSALFALFYVPFRLGRILSLPNPHKLFGIIGGLGLIGFIAWSVFIFVDADAINEIVDQVSSGDSGQVATSPIDQLTESVQQSMRDKCVSAAVSRMFDSVAIRMECHPLRARIGDRQRDRGWVCRRACVARCGRTSHRRRCAR